MVSFKNSLNLELFEHLRYSFSYPLSPMADSCLPNPIYCYPTVYVH